MDDTAKPIVDVPDLGMVPNLEAAINPPPFKRKQGDPLLRLLFVKDHHQQTKLAFALSSAAIGPVFGCFGTYVTYQIQYIAYAVGANPGQPMGYGCLDLSQPCRIPLAGSGDVNLTSYLLYLNAFAFAISGALTLLVSGYGDYLGWKREQYIFLTVAYGCFALPVAGMTAYTTQELNSYAALYVVFFTVGFLAGAWQNVYIPAVMFDESSDLESRRQREIRGASTSVWGFNAYNGTLVIFYCITIGITYVNASAAVQAGLWVTTATAVLCIVLALFAWPFLPSPAAKPLPPGTNTWMLPFVTLKELWFSVRKYPEAVKYVAAFTVYNDSVFAFSAVLSQLFTLSLRPSLLEYTYYSIIGTATSVVAPTLWLYLFRYTDRLSLRDYTIAAYGLVAFSAAWCLIGFSDRAKVGFKHRWEFYLFQVILYTAYGCMSAIFRVQYGELFPRGAEVQHYGFQLALASLTTWIPQVADSAIVDATNLIRLPVAVALAMILVAMGLTWWVDVEKGVAAVERVANDAPPQPHTDKESTGTEV